MHGSHSIYVNLTNEEKENQLKVSILYIHVLDPLSSVKKRTHVKAVGTVKLACLEKEHSFRNE